MFKCIDSYCIPWAYVCDGKWDCLEGDDELSNPVCLKDKICVFMFECRNVTQRCLHLGNVCDSNKDCPFGDDELFCDLKIVKCPLKYDCLLLAVSCRNASHLILDTEGPFI